MKFGFKIIIILILVLGAIAIITYMNRAGAGNTTETVKTVEREQHPVQIEIVSPQTLLDTLNKTGVMAANQDVILTAQVGGRIVKLNKEMGDTCNKGEMVLQIEKGDYQIALLQAKASLKLAEASKVQSKNILNRIAKLRESEVATAQEFENAVTASTSSIASWEQTQAAQKMALKNLRDTTIRCPFDGKIAARMVEIGQSVGPSVPLVRLVDVSKLKLTISLSSAQLSNLQVGRKVLLADATIPNISLEGEVARLGVAANMQTKSFPVEIQANNQENQFRPGQVVNATCEIGIHKNVFSIPRGVLLEQNDQAIVFVAIDGTASARKVKPGKFVADRVIIEAGLARGDRVVVLGQDALIEGSQIEILDEESNLESATQEN